jgi:regulator of sigma E protease
MILMSLIAALDWATVIWWVDVILKVAIGLGAVIFVHELGHYLVALACGVKIEKFMIGFDIGGIKLSRRWGETEYGIGILPLGGYVKMLGQDDDPAHIAEQMKKSEVGAQSENAVPIHGPDGETYYVDRRSYLAKSVPQRMAIISAGVVMNVIFAFIFAVIAYGMGVSYVPSIMSETVPGSPAWQAGLEPNDEIIQLGDRVKPTFTQLKGGVTLGDLEEGIPVVVRRAADGEVVSLTLRPRQQNGRLATIGVGGPLSLTLREGSPFFDNSPAARAKLVSPTPGAETKPQFQSGDQIVRVGDTPVDNYRDFAAELARRSEDPLLITVERSVIKRTDDPTLGATVHVEQPQELTLEVPPQPLEQFGLVMRIGPITSVQRNSPAANAGLQAGDVIETVDGQPIAEGKSADVGWDPMTLPHYLRKAALEEREVELTVRRAAKEGETAESITLRLTPAVPITMHSDFHTGTPMAAEAIGIAYHIENEVQAVRVNSPAANSDIAPGDRIISAKVKLPETSEPSEGQPERIELGPNNHNWPALMSAMQFAPEGTQVEFTLERGADEEARAVTLAPQPADGVFIASRGFLLMPVVLTREAATFAEQVRYGWDETAEALTMVFRFIRKLGTQVPITALGGPVTIATVAGYSAAEGLSSLLIFLTMLSANLAVINFLPIPLLDGGHMVFLAYEGIRGRPASERFVVALHTAGFLFIVSLMLFVLALDFGLIDRGL